MGREDPDNEDSIHTINPDNSAFKLFNSGKEVLRSYQQIREKKEQRKQEKKAAKRKDNLELEDVESLQERLNKHLLEIKRLFGEDDGGESDPDEDDEINMLEQIAKLKEIINMNKKIIEGEDLEGSDGEGA